MIQLPGRLSLMLMYIAIYDGRPSCLALLDEVARTGHEAAAMEHIMASYRKHTHANLLLPGFKDIPKETWEFLDVGDKKRVRIYRLNRWYREVYTPKIWLDEGDGL